MNHIYRVTGLVTLIIIIFLAPGGCWFGTVFVSEPMFLFLSWVKNIFLFITFVIYVQQLETPSLVLFCSL